MSQCLANQPNQSNVNSAQSSFSSSNKQQPLEQPSHQSQHQQAHHHQLQPQEVLVQEQQYQFQSFHPIGEQQQQQPGPLPPPPPQQQQPMQPVAPLVPPF